MKENIFSTKLVKKLVISQNILLRNWWALLLIIHLGLWNRYIFAQVNIILLLLLMVLFLIYKKIKIFDQNLFFNSINWTWIVFLAYSVVNFRSPFISEIAAIADYVALDLEQMKIIYLFLFYGIFCCSIILYHHYGYLCKSLWALITTYFFLHMLYSLFIMQSLRQSAHIASGVLIFVLVPFVLLRIDHKKKKFINILITIPIVWCAILGVRGCTVSLLMLILFLNAMPLITKNKVNYYFCFFSLFFVIIVYMMIYLNGNKFFSYNTSIIANPIFNVFNKRLGTRIEIWSPLISKISKGNLIFGSGSDRTSSQELNNCNLDIYLHSETRDILYLSNYNTELTKKNEIYIDTLMKKPNLISYSIKFHDKTHKFVSDVCIQEQFDLKILELTPAILRVVLHRILQKKLFDWYKSDTPCMMRANLAAHSLYLELIYRLGVVGLLLFISILFFIWRFLWSGRNLWEVKIGLSVILSTLFLSVNMEFCVFDSLPLLSGFFWAILGVSVGACHKNMRMYRY